MNQLFPPLDDLPMGREPRQGPAAGPAGLSAGQARSFLTAMGDRCACCARCATRKTLANETGLSERHLANLNRAGSIAGTGQIAATERPPASDGDETTASAEWLLIRELLWGSRLCGAAARRRALAEMFA